MSLDGVEHNQDFDGESPTVELPSHSIIILMKSQGAWQLTVSGYTTFPDPPERVDARLASARLVTKGNVPEGLEGVPRQSLCRASDSESRCSG